MEDQLQRKKVSRLTRPVMTIREAARQLVIPHTTLLYWLEGGERHGVLQPPVLREEPTGSNDVNWGEYVEARYLRAYRDTKGVSMQRLRPFISALREEFGVPYPLAHFKPFVDKRRRLLLELQGETDLPSEFSMVYEHRSGQIVLDARTSDFLDRVDFAEHGDREALRLYPAGRRSPVLMQPGLSSAAATVRGVRTENLVELADAGMAVDEIAEDFELDPEDVKAALSYEWGKAA